MRNLQEDRTECDNATTRGWVARTRRQRGIHANTAVCWFVVVEQGSDRNEIWFSRSPSDALHYASTYADDAPRNGTGRWTLEVYGDGENPPKYLLVYPVLDEDGYK